MVQLTPKARRVVQKILGSDGAHQVFEKELSKEDIAEVKQRVEEEDHSEVFDTGYTEQDFLEDLAGLENKMFESVSDLVEVANERKAYRKQAEKAPAPVDQMFWSLASSKSMDIKVEMKKFFETMSKYLEKKQYLGAYRQAMIESDELEDANVDMSGVYGEFNDKVGGEHDFDPEKQQADMMVQERMNTGSMEQLLEEEKRKAREGDESEGLGLSEEERQEMFEDSVGDSLGFEDIFEYEESEEVGRERENSRQ